MHRSHRVELGNDQRVGRRQRLGQTANEPKFSSSHTTYGTPLPCFVHVLLEMEPACSHRSEFRRLLSICGALAMSFS